MNPNKNNRLSGKIRNWFTWALLALLPGVTGWFIVLTQEQIQQNRSETYRSISQQQKDEFLEMYHEWSRLSPQEKAENPWGTGPYGGPDVQKKLLRNQEERLLADLPDLLSETGFPSELGDILYGSGWRTRVEEFRKQIEYQEILSVCSSILIAAGILGFVVGTGFWIRERIAIRSSREAEEKASKPDSSAASPEKEEGDESSEAKPEEVHLFKPKKHKPASPAVPKNRPAAPEESESEETDEEAAAGVLAGQSESTGAAAAKGSSKKSATKSLEQAETAAAVLSEVLEAETAADPLLSSLMTPEPVAKELTELTEQMSAIREFAAEQQTQVKKLQDGYDWMLIKRFCLRIIRCIDNIDDRVRVLEAEKKDISSLEDVRDELIFALESSGVEPYQPEINRDYRGLEKYAEAVKERQKNDDPEKTGKIAEIIRAGYQYLISDEEVKIVRCAQVKLYA